MRSLPRSATVVAMLVATLAACETSGTDDRASTSAPTQNSMTPLSAVPADGAIISSDEFTYAVPEGWAASDQSRAASLAIDLEDRDGFADNINVVRDNTIVGIEGAELEDAAKQVLADASATHITAHDPVQVDGEEAVHVSAFFELTEPKYRTEQYAVAHDETGYIVTLSFSPDVPASERNKVSESILTTWRWES
jgi:hypothetical protein